MKCNWNKVWIEQKTIKKNLIVVDLNGCTTVSQLLTGMWLRCTVSGNYKLFRDSDRRNTVRTLRFWSLFLCCAFDCVSLWIKVAAKWIQMTNVNVKTEQMSIRTARTCLLWCGSCLLQAAGFNTAFTIQFSLHMSSAYLMWLQWYIIWMGLLRR